MEVAGYNLDSLLAGAAPLIGLFILALCIFGILGIILFMVYRARKSNWLIFPWEYNWNYLVHIPSGNSSYPLIDRGATIFEGSQVRIKLQKLGFITAMPDKEFIRPFKWVEAFSNGSRHLTLVKRTFVGYHGAPDPSIMAEIDAIDDKLAAFKTMESVTTISRAAETRIESERKGLLAERQELENQMSKKANLAYAYEPVLDANTQNVQLFEGEKVLSIFRLDDGISKQAMILGAFVLMVFISLLFQLQAEGVRAAAAAGQTDAMNTLSEAISGSVELQNITIQLMNKTLNRVNLPAPSNG